MERLCIYVERLVPDRLANLIKEEKPRNVLLPGQSSKMGTKSTKRLK